MALNRSPYDARVTPPKQRRGARGNGAGRCVRQTTCLADAICTRYLGWSGRYCSIPAVWGLREETVEGNHLAKCSRGRGGRWALEGGRHLFPKRPRPTSRRQHSSLPHSKGGWGGGCHSVAATISEGMRVKGLGTLVGRKWGGGSLQVHKCRGKGQWRPVGRLARNQNGRRRFSGRAPAQDGRRACSTPPAARGRARQVVVALRPHDSMVPRCRKRQSAAALRGRERPAGPRRHHPHPSRAGGEQVGRGRPGREAGADGGGR